MNEETKNKLDDQSFTPKEGSSTRLADQTICPCQKGVTHYVSEHVSATSSESPTPAGEEVAIKVGSKLRLTKDIYEEGEDLPPGRIAKKGDIVFVKTITEHGLGVAHEGNPGRFRLEEGEYLVVPTPPEPGNVATPRTDAAIYAEDEHGNIIGCMYRIKFPAEEENYFYTERSYRKVQAELATATKALEEARKEISNRKNAWRMSSVCRELVAENARLTKALAEAEGKVKHFEDKFHPCNFPTHQATNCGKCGDYKHTPWRDDEYGYVCATCLTEIKDEQNAALADRVAKLADLLKECLPNLGEHNPQWPKFDKLDECPSKHKYECGACELRRKVKEALAAEPKASGEEKA